MQQYLIYIIPAAVVLIIFIAAFAYSRKAAAKYKQRFPCPCCGNMTLAQNGAYCICPVCKWEDNGVTDPSKYSGPNHMTLGEAQKNFHEFGSCNTPKHSGVYEAPGVDQQSGHTFGAVQSVIRGRIRFLMFGIMLIGVAAFGLYVLYAMPDKLPDFTETTLNKIIATVILAGGGVWGLQLISYTTYRVTLRRTGFEISSVFGTKAYEYKDVDFHLEQKVEHKYESEGYRPVVMKAGNFNSIWVCQVIFRDGRKPIMLKSSRYAWLKNKMQSAIDRLYGGGDNV